MLGVMKSSEESTQCAGQYGLGGKDATRTMGGIMMEIIEIDRATAKSGAVTKEVGRRLGSPHLSVDCHWIAHDRVRSRGFCLLSIFCLLSYLRLQAIKCITRRDRHPTKRQRCFRGEEVADIPPQAGMDDPVDQEAAWHNATFCPVRLWVAAASPCAPSMIR